MSYRGDFYAAHEERSQTKESPIVGGLVAATGLERFPIWGAINTTVLLISSFTMVLAVRSAQLRKKMDVLKFLGMTNICAAIFLVIKFTFEWPPKFGHKLVPGPNFGPHAGRVWPARAGTGAAARV